jgi:excisionase family DNA binding protein
MNVRQAAVRLEVSVSTVYGLIAVGNLRCYRIGTGRGAIRIDESQIEAFLSGAESRSRQEPPREAPPRLKHLRIK